MTFLFETTTYRDGDPVRARVHRNNEDGYYIELSNHGESATFHIYKVNNKWTASEFRQQRQAEQIGVVIDQKKE